jgi:hypothetical protein
MPRRDEKGINPAFPILIIFIIVFVGVVYYLATPSQPTQTNISPSHTYFDQESFALPIGQTWRVGVPIQQDGNLHLSISANSTVQLYVKEGTTYLLNNLVAGGQNYTLPVTSTMNVLEVGVTNVGLGPVQVQQFTCVWTP